MRVFEFAINHWFLIGAISILVCHFKQSWYYMFQLPYSGRKRIAVMVIGWLLGPVTLITLVVWALLVWLMEE